MSTGAVAPTSVLGSCYRSQSPQVGAGIPLNASWGVGTLLIEGPSGRTEIVLAPGPAGAPHNRHMRLLPTDALAVLVTAMADDTSHVEIDFGGFGRLHLKGTWGRSAAGLTRKEMDPGLRGRLRSFLLQLCPATPPARYTDDLALIEAFALIKPGAPLVPHYRSLAKELLVSGFEIKSFWGAFRNDLSL